MFLSYNFPYEFQETKCRGCKRVNFFPRPPGSIWEWSCSQSSQRWTWVPPLLSIGRMWEHWWLHCGPSIWRHGMDVFLLSQQYRDLASDERQPSNQGFFVVKTSRSFLTAKCSWTSYRKQDPLRISASVSLRHHTSVTHLLWISNKLRALLWTRPVGDLRDK